MEKEKEKEKEKSTCKEYQVVIGTIVENLLKIKLISV